MPHKEQEAQVCDATGFDNCSTAWLQKKLQRFVKTVITTFTQIFRMDKIVAAIGELFYSYANQPCQSVTKIEQSGSDRIYFRLSLDDKTYIATYNHNVKENKTFISFSKHFSELGLPVPGSV